MTPTESKALEDSVRYLLTIGELDAALSLAEEGAKDSGVLELWALWGVASARRGLGKQAIEALTYVIVREPYDARYWTYLAEAQLELLDHEGASTSLERACELDPEAKDAFGKRSRALIARTRKELKAKG